MYIHKVSNYRSYKEISLVGGGICSNMQEEEEEEEEELAS